VIKSAPIRPVTWTSRKNEYARIRPRLPFGSIFGSRRGTRRL